MLLTVDVGNTNTVFGVFEGERLLEHWRLATWEARTSDEYWVALNGLFTLRALELKKVDGCIVASVVPATTQPLLRFCEQRLDVPTLVVGPGIKTGMPILYDNPKEVGADRIVNAVAAYAQYRSGLVVVDFGTATTFDCVSPAGEYLGGVIVPGIGISADALFQKAAKLPRVELSKPRQVIGKSTVTSIQSGLFYGYSALVDGIVNQVRTECGFPLRVIATGGQASLVAQGATTIEKVDELLTLTGLRLLYELNKNR